MASQTVPHVHLEAVEEAENPHKTLRKLGISPGQAHQWGNTRLGYWRVAGSQILKCSITDKKLALAGYFDILAQYEHLRILRLCG